MNFGTLFSGFGGADIGMMAAGLTPTWGVELDPRVADVANANLGNHIITANVLDVDPATLEPVYALHASPPCTRASVANSRAETNEDGIREAPLDIALAEKVIQFVKTLQPQIFTLENVWQYRKFQSWQGGKKAKGIAQALWDLGYWVAVEHVNAADYGVPQTRKRMIVRAIRGGMVPHLPQPSRWIGWHEAIRDILDTLPPSEFAPWQLKRLPATIGDILIGNQSSREAGLTSSLPHDPAFTLRTSRSDYPRAYLMDLGNTSRAATSLDADRPAMTIQSWHGRRPSHMPSAFLLGNGTRSAPQAEDTPADGGAPAMRDAADPSLTVDTKTASHLKSWLAQGRVVSMTPRALARFQSFPDWYTLPESKTLACLGIGNAVPPLLMETVYRQLVETNQP